MSMPAPAADPPSAPPARAAEREEPHPAPRRLPDTGTPSTSGPAECAAPRPLFPVSLLTALRLGLTTNLDIAQARETVNQAQARLDKARVSLLPNFNLGSQYLHHEGNIQKTEGNIIKVNKDSLFVGGGPSLTFQTAEALYGPLVALQVERGTEAGLGRVTDETLLAVANAYFNVLLARRRLARIEETLDFLTSERTSTLRGGARGLLPLIRAVVEAGGAAARQADLARVEVEVMRRREEWIAARQDLLLAVAELARLIRLDPATPLWPVEDFRVPLRLAGDGWADQPLPTLEDTALSSRPELVETRALVEAARAQVQVAKYRPFLPNVVMNYSWGDFGGGPDLNPPLNGKAVPGFGPSGRILHFAPRTDFDVALQWRLENLGFGNRADVRERGAAERQAQLRQLQAIDRILTQVVQSQEAVQAWRQRVTMNRDELFDASGAPTGPVYRSITLTFDRIRGAEGRVLELLDSIRTLSDVLESYGVAVTEYERSRFRLLVALGLPPDGFVHPEAMPLPPRPEKLCPPANPPAPEAVSKESEPSPSR
jgi:outer membrane protein TolC